MLVRRRKNVFLYGRQACHRNVEMVSASPAAGSGKLYALYRFAASGFCLVLPLFFLFFRKNE